MTTIEMKLRNAAAANAGLIFWLGTSPFNWFPVQLPQTAAMPSVVYQRISRVPVSSFIDPIGNMARYRMQFRIYAQGANSAEDSRKISDALIAFMRTFTATQGTQHANQLVAQQEGIERPEAQPPYWVQRMDFMIFNREDL